MSASNIYERARQMVAQAKGPLSFSEALARLGKRGANSAKRRKRAKLDPVPPQWLPYRDD